MGRSHRLIMGRNCITEVVRLNPERLLEVFTTQRSGEDSLYDELERNGIKIIDTTKKNLTKMVQSESHQSYVAAVKDQEQISVKSFLKNSQQKEHSVVLMLDSIYDPQNMGAILRAAECFGVDLVLFSKNRGADITPVTTKTSAGATELVPITKVSNLAETIKLFQKAGYLVIAADVGEDSKSLDDTLFPEKTVLVMGSEGKGIQPLVRKTCDHAVYIPMLGQIDSLNVSQATAVLLSTIRRANPLS